VSVQIVMSDEACAMATIANVVVMVWRGPPTAARLARGFEVVLPLAERRGTRVGVVTVIEHGAPSPEPRDRIPFMRQLAWQAHVFAGVAMVFEGGGAWTSAMLDVASGMLGVVGRLRHPFKHCIGAREAAAWLAIRAAEAAPDAPSRDDICGAIELARASIGRHPIERTS
jgi:hypothetical protein